MKHLMIVCGLCYIYVIWLDFSKIWKLPKVAWSDWYIISPLLLDSVG